MFPIVFDLLKFMLHLEFDNLLIMVHPNNFMLSFMVYNFMGLLQFHNHLHPQEVTCQVINQYKVDFFLKIIFPISTVVVLMEPCV